MIALDGEEIRIQLIEDVGEKRRKSKEVALMLWIGIRAIEKQVWRWRHYGKEWIRRKKPGPRVGKPYNRTKSEIEEVVCLYGEKYKREWPKEVEMEIRRVMWNNITWGDNI
jgi:transposase